MIWFVFVLFWKTNYSKFQNNSSLVFLYFFNSLFFFHALFPLNLKQCNKALHSLIALSHRLILVKRFEWFAITVVRYPRWGQTFVGLNCLGANWLRPRWSVIQGGRTVLGSNCHKGDLSYPLYASFSGFLYHRCSSHSLLLSIFVLLDVNRRRYVISFNHWSLQRRR